MSNVSKPFGQTADSTGLAGDKQGENAAAADGLDLTVGDDLTPAVEAMHGGDTRLTGDAD